MYGAASASIVPLRPCSLAGYFNERIWDKILDDIEVRALVFNYSGHYFAIVQYDLVTISEYFAEAFLKKISDVKEISRENIIITATHSHTAPEIRIGKPGCDSQYIEDAAEAGAKTLRKALSEMKEGRLFRGRTFNHDLSFNRRYFMKDGTILTNPGKLNPEIEHSEGTTDPEIPILGIKDNAGNWQVILANISNHADTVGGNGVSSDWHGFMRRELQKTEGKDLMLFSLVACSGDINHLDVMEPSEQFSYAEAERVGKGYAESVKKALSRMTELAKLDFKSSSVSVTTGAREISKEEQDEARAVLEKYKDIPDAENGGELHSVDLAKKTPAALKFFAKALLKTAEDKEERIFRLCGFSPCEGIYIVSLPAEPFVEIGLEIKWRIFPGSLVMVVEHSNGTGSPNLSGGYIPNKWNYGRGGYETTPRSNPFAMDTSEKLLAGISILSKKLTSL